MAGRLVVWADYALAALAWWAADLDLRGACVGRLLLSRSLRRRHPRGRTVCAGERLHAVKERVHRGRTALDRSRESVAARAAVVGRHIDRARRPALYDLSLDAYASQGAVVQRGGDGRPDLLVRGTLLGRHAVDEGARHGYLAAESLVILLALTICDSPAAIAPRLAFNPLAMAPVVLCGWSVR